MKQEQREQSKHNSKGATRLIGAFALAAGFFLMTALPAVATEDTQYEDVIINGHNLGFFEQMVLEDFIGQDIPNGNYWFELETGLWGPVGGPAIGHIKIPEVHRDYIESKFKIQGQTAKAERPVTLNNDTSYYN